MVQFLITINLSALIITLFLFFVIIGFWSDIVDIMNTRRRWNK